MASGRMEFHCDSLMQHANFTFVLPNDAAMEMIREPRHYDREPLNLILLHGLTGTDTDWLYGGNAQTMAEQYNLNIFMPTTGNSFYLDRGYAGGNYAEFVAEELPDYIQETFRIDMRRDNTMIGGLSMGGYGALHLALSRPERFCGCIALSSAAVIKVVASGKRQPHDLLPPGLVLEIFGDPSKLTGSDRDIEAQFKRLKESGADIPRIYMAVGTEDALINANRELRDNLRELGADLIYEEGPGKHDWFFWNEYVERGLKALIG